MNKKACINALKEYNPIPPSEALVWTRGHWKVMKNDLLNEMDECLAHPLNSNRDALFIYACYHCAEEHCEEAFERYVNMCRLPSPLQDFLLGDMLTQNMGHWLALTCRGRIQTIKSLVEDPNVNEFARSKAVYALCRLTLDKDIESLSFLNYCQWLLEEGLERWHSYVWDGVISAVHSLYPGKLLPQIRLAYETGLADPTCCDLEEIE